VVQPSNEKSKSQKYSCPNPNCKKVFSRPKIIKYNVCPTCQTLVDESNFVDLSENVIPSHKQKVSINTKPKATEQSEFLKIGVLNMETTKSGQTELEVLTITGLDDGIEANKKSMDTEHSHQSPQETSKKSHLQEKIEISAPPEPTEIPQPQQITTAEFEKTEEPLRSCQYHFGYLSHREAGAGIPDTCIECPDSLNCMLSQYDKSRKSVREISKWYK
jgi:hypothetical protein